MVYDAIVVGLGGMGSAAAYHLASRGKSVLGLERHAPAHALGSSHGQSRIIRQAYFEDPAYVPLLLRAYELWEKLERETGEDLMTLCGGLMVGREDGELVSGSVRSAEEYDLPYELLDAGDLARRFPPLSPDPETVALYETKAGFVRPEAAVKAHLDRAAAMGAELRFEETVLRWEASESGTWVETGNGAYEAERLVISPGAWAPDLLAELRLPLEVTRQVMYWFEPTGGLEAFLPDRFPIWIWEPDDDNAFYGFPAERGDRSVKVAFFRADGVRTTADTIRREVDPQESEFLRGYLKRYIPDLNGRFVDAKACMYTNTPDLHFVVSPHPDHENVVVACGFSGHGFKFCGVIGEILADLAADGSTSHPVSLFSPARLVETNR